MSTTIGIPSSWGHLTTRLDSVHIVFFSGSPSAALVEGSAVDDTGVIRGHISLRYDYPTGQLSADGVGLVGTATAPQQTSVNNGTNLFGAMLDLAVTANSAVVRV